MWVCDVNIWFDDLPQKGRADCWRRWHQYFKREEEEPTTITEVLTIFGDPDLIDTHEGAVIFSWNDTETYIDGYESLVGGFRMMLDNSF